MKLSNWVDVRIYNYVLTSDQVKQVYNFGAARLGTETDIVDPSGQHEGSTRTNALTADQIKTVYNLGSATLGTGE
ncbi:hypothetical protein KKD20_00160 [Patescibacteria group bacterium]|nr:hypothetical protein [Patescibacteria group bacterium]